MLAICGAAWSWKRWRRSRALVVALGALLATPSLSLLLISPGDPWAAKGSGAQSGLAWSASPAAVDRAVAVARRCPRNQPYSGIPYAAFLANRRMPGHQPDLFIIQAASITASFAKRAALDRPRCPSKYRLVIP